YLVLIVIVFRRAGASDAATLNALSFGMIALAASTALQSIWKGPVGSGYLTPPVFSAIYNRPRRAGGRHWRAASRFRDDDVRRLGRDWLRPAAAPATRAVSASDQRANRSDCWPATRCNRHRRPSRRRTYPPADLSLSRDGGWPYFGNHVRPQCLGSRHSAPDLFDARHRDRNAGWRRGGSSIGRFHARLFRCADGRDTKAGLSRL